MARRIDTARVVRLGEEPAGQENLSGSTTAAERLRILHRLSERAWALTGRERPEYQRSEMPVRVARLG